jgi:hypothetical protein
MTQALEALDNRQCIASLSESVQTNYEVRNMKRLFDFAIVLGGLSCGMSYVLLFRDALSQRDFTLLGSMTLACLAMIIFVLGLYKKAVSDERIEVFDVKKLAILLLVTTSIFLAIIRTGLPR